MVWSFYYYPLSNFEAIEQANTWYRTPKERGATLQTPHSTRHSACNATNRATETDESGLDVTEAADQET